MRYEPYDDEYAAVPTMTDEELLEYFLYSILETDEVWGLKDGPHWIIREMDGRETLPLWPFKRFAAEAVDGEWQDFNAGAESLEFFIYNTLNQLAAQDAMVEIMPRKSQVGCLINPRRLAMILENTMYSGEYTLED